MESLHAGGPVRIGGANADERRSPSTLHAHDLFELVDDFDEVVLLLHHAVDVLVGFRGFVEHAVVFTAFDAFGLAREIGESEALFRLAAARG